MVPNLANDLWKTEERVLHVVFNKNVFIHFSLMMLALKQAWLGDTVQCIIAQVGLTCHFDSRVPSVGNLFVNTVHQIVAKFNNKKRGRVGRPIKIFRDSDLFQYQIHLYIVYTMIVPIFHTRTHLFGLKHSCTQFCRKNEPISLGTTWSRNCVRAI